MFVVRVCTHVRQEVEQRVAGERADSERDEVLDERRVEAALHHRDDGHGAQSHETDHRHRQQRVPPH